jgi:uncharacterized Zn finger protein
MKNVVVSARARRNGARSFHNPAAFSCVTASSQRIPDFHIAFVLIAGQMPARGQPFLFGPCLVREEVVHRPAPNPNYKPKPATPRKVRGGIKLASSTGAFPESWAAQRWMRLIEQIAPGETLRAGLGYASAGQTRRVTFEPGRVVASIQGSQYTPYETDLTVQPFSHDASEKLVAAMSDQAVHAAKLLSGELTPSVEDLMAPLGLRLFPAEAGEVTPRCTCKEARGIASSSAVGVEALRAQTSSENEPAPIEAPSPATTPHAGPIWCKHACCLAYLVAERLARDPFVMFTLRSLPKEELIERLRQRRVVAGSALGGALVYQPAVPGASDVTSPPLEECLENFWDKGPELDHVEAPVEPPQVSHPLLRRLGPSPMGGKFPLVGLLATCYDVISQRVLTADREPVSDLHGESNPDADSPSSGD